MLVGLILDWYILDRSIWEQVRNAELVCLYYLTSDPHGIWVSHLCMGSTVLMAVCTGMVCPYGPNTHNDEKYGFEQPVLVITIVIKYFL